MRPDLLLAALEPLAETLDRIDLAEPLRALAALEDALPKGGTSFEALRAIVTAPEAETWLLPHERAGIRFGRVTADLAGFSVDAVELDRAGPAHVHPQGEIDLLFATAGDPRFCGHPEGWAVFPPGSRHVPEVRGGTMRILYFLPGGAIEWC